ncbi:MAG: glycosyltransferase family 4 protein [Flavobacteriaceae bacterium]|nr:glycosyltransferase family 4 protein [Flavobacteriaceae bacterium]
MNTKRVLIICYYWPPAGGPGVQRWLKFVKYLGEFGVDPIVFVPDNAHYPIVDRAFEAEIPENVEVIRFPIKEPYRFAKWFSKKKTKTISSGIISEKRPSFLENAMLFIRGNLFIPDARVGWVKPASRFLQKYLTENKIDTIVTTGPPHSLHLIGMQLKQALNVRWIADFRDPWTTIHYHKSLRLTKSSEKKHKALEKEVLTQADAVVVTSPGTKKEFSEITKTPITVITNGYEPISNTTRSPDEKFTLVHIGSLLSSRNPTVLWKVISELVVENSEFAAQCQIKLAGAVSKDVISSLDEFGLTKYVVELGYVSHREALQLQRNAQVLLLIEMNRPETRAIIPGKIFEYLLAKRPILSLGPEGSDIKAIIEETNTGQFFTYTEERLLKNQLWQYFQDYSEMKLEVGSGDIEEYSRRELTKVMAELLKE